MAKFKISRRFCAFLIMALSTAFFMSLLRVIFYFVNKPEGPLSYGVIARAFFTGARFDLRIAFLFALPLGILFLLPYKKLYKNISAYAYAAAFGLLMLVYFVDFGYYAYLQERLNSYIIDLAADTATSLEMVWQTYPVIWGFIALAAAMLLYFIFVKKLLLWVYARTEPKKNYYYIIPALLIAAAFVHGRFSQYPLRWSEAYFSPDTFVSSLALNPVQNIFDTYVFAKKDKGFNKNETEKYYDIVSEYLGVKDKTNLNFTRDIAAAKGGVKNYNIVIIFAESLAFDKTTFNNPRLNATPYIYEFAKRGVLFKNFFTPTLGTARGVFTSITGLPDTAATETSSRNPRLVKQHTLVNDLADYQKMYFIGGSTSWGNIRGLLQSNIEGLKIYEEGAYKDAGRLDVWGISDLDMFRHAAQELAKSQKPFFAFLQTAGYHRPYSIPKDRGSFEISKISDEEVKRYGFNSAEEFNSLRFQDYAIGEFLRLAEKEDFFKNTIFFIFGDHGLPVKQSEATPGAMIQLGLTVHNVPLIIVGPGINPGVNLKTASQADITATMASLLGMAYSATGIGRDIFDASNAEGAFILPSGAAPVKLGFIEGGYYYVDWPNLKGMYDYRADDLSVDYCPQYPRQCERMKNLSRGLYEAARYITYHQK